jgi:hypothetical protein
MTTNIEIKEGRSHNSGFVKWRVQCLFENLVLNSNLVHLMKFSAKNPPLHKAAKRYRQV